MLFCLGMYAQQNDSVPEKTELEKKTDIKILQDYSKSNKSKFGKFIHKTLFRKRSSESQTRLQAVRQKEIDFDYDKHQGKIIRNIKIVTMDPFGHSVIDSTRTPTKKAEIIGNKLHLKTKQFTIRNILLFKKNQPLDSLKLKESERLIRQQRYIRSVIVKPIPIEGSNDSIDVSIRVLDTWSIYPNGSLSTSTARLRVTSQNFAGLGHYFSNQYTTRFKEGRHGYNSQYQINNISNTFINTGLYYNRDLDKNVSKGIYAERNFYSPLAKWAGGISINDTYYKDSIPNLIIEKDKQDIKYTYYDIWAGRSFHLFDKYKDVKIRTNLITSIRYYNQNYKQTPQIEFDPEQFYSDQQMVLATIGVSSINYVQDKYIFNYDRIEDVAVGKIISVVGGLHYKNGIRRPYLGSKVSIGKYTRSGYFGGEIQWGTYFNGNNLEQSVIRLEGIYFSRLWEWGNWKFRQFINPEIVYGYNRLNYAKDRISLNGSNGINGFDSYTLWGTKKVVLNFQLQSYAPTEVLGFRFSPFLSATMAFMGDENNAFVNKDMYSKIGLGILITNDYLVFNNIQLSIAFYPRIPGDGSNIIKTNNLRNSNFDLQNFNFGKPTTVPFQ